MISRSYPATARDAYPADSPALDLVAELVFHADDAYAMTAYFGPNRIRWVFARDLWLYALLSFDPQGDGDVCVARDGEGGLVLHVTSPEGEALVTLAESDAREFAQVMLTEVPAKAEVYDLDAWIVSLLEGAS